MPTPLMFPPIPPEGEFLRRIIDVWHTAQVESTLTGSFDTSSGNFTPEIKPGRGVTGPKQPPKIMRGFARNIGKGIALGLYTAALEIAQEQLMEWFYDWYLRFPGNSREADLLGCVEIFLKLWGEQLPELDRKPKPQLRGKPPGGKDRRVRIWGYSRCNH